MSITKTVLKVSPSGEKFISISDLIIHLQTQLLELNKRGVEADIDAETILVHLINEFTRMKQ
jgi:hypothetical protein